MAAMTCLLSLWSVSALPVPQREEGEARGGREGQEGKKLTKSHGIVDVDCLYVVSKFCENTTLPHMWQRREI